MSERKKLKAEKDVSKAKKLYETLKLAQPQSEDAFFKGYVEYFISTLSIPCVRSYGIMGLAELVRISGSVDILTPTELIVLFEALYETIISEEIALDTFLHLGIPSYMKNKRLILKFFELAQRTEVRNREYLKKILTIFIEESEDRSKYIDIIVQNSRVCRDLVESVYKYIDITALAEDDYLRLFCENECIRVSKDFRAVKGRKRLHFVQKAIDSHYQAVMENYIKDRDKRVRLVLAGRVAMSDERFLRILLNDHDEDVRLAVLKRIKWSPSLPDISERLLDKSYNVRREMIRIYREGTFKLRQLPIFKKELLKTGRLGFDGDNDCEPSKDYEMLVRFVYRLFEGCLTIFRDEYIQAIRESNFTLDFLAEHQDCPGAHSLFSTMEITSYSEVPQDLRSFCLGHLYRGSLNDREIMDALEDNVFAALNFIKDPSAFFDILLEKAMTVQDLQSVELIVESIKELLSKKMMIRGTGDVGCSFSISSIDDTITSDSRDPVKGGSASDPFEFRSSNLYLVNAHTRCEQVFVEQQFGKGAYHHLYFIVHQLRNDPRVPLCLKNCTLSTDQKIRLLVYLDDPKILADFSDLLVRHDLGFKLQNDLLARRTLTASLIYFLCTGLVSVKSPSFFIKCIKSALSCSSSEKVKWIFERYIGAVDQKTFDLFYSICWALKGCSTLRMHSEAAIDGSVQNDSIILNPKISTHNYVGEANGPLNASLGLLASETTITTAPFTGLSGTGANQNIDCRSSNSQGFDENAKTRRLQYENEPPSASSQIEKCKLKLAKADKMLYFICNLVIGSRKGAFTELSANFARYGFFKMSESHAEMVGRGQVLYE